MAREVDAQEVIESLEIERWSGPFPPELRQRAVAALEGGKVLYCPKLAFVLEAGEEALLSPNLSNGKAKNVSFDPLTGSCQGTVAGGETRERLAAMMERFASGATRLVSDLLPGYAAGLERARTSYRPIEIDGRSYSPIKDDTLLHPDAFPSRPTHGRRILRLFSNIDPAGKARLWHLGEPFEAFAQRFVAGLRPQLAGEAWLLQALGITKGRRSGYDHLMLGLHDRGKRDAAYQQSARLAEFAFAPGTTWLCYTDQVLHAALAGQFALEQTFHLDIAVMADPRTSPLKVLERLTGRALA